MNEASAIEWLEKSWHNLSAAKVLYDANHYTDIIAVELHYSVEKTLKAFLAYENKKIVKTHDLSEIYEMVKSHINLDDKLELLEQISDYHIEEAYPVFDRKLPPEEEIKEALVFAQVLFETVCEKLDINQNELKWEKK